MSRCPLVLSAQPILTLALALAVLPPAAAGAYRCTSATGEMSFSDQPCPPDAVNQQAVNIPTPAPASGRSATADNPYSVINQARMIDQREAQEAARRAAQAAATQAPSPAPAVQTAPGGPSQVVLTYEQALKFALHDAGYHQYGNLNQLQKERVHDEMKKYKYLPPVPRKSAQSAASEQPPLLVNGVPATPTGNGNYIDNRTGHFLQGAAGGVIDTESGQFLPTY